MIYRVSYAPRVENDLRRARREIVLASQNEDVATAYLRRILEAANSLAEFPERFPVWRYDTSLRAMPAEKYHLFYRVSGSTVRIIHIRYAGRTPFRSSASPFLQ